MTASKRVRLCMKDLFHQDVVEMVERHAPQEAPKCVRSEAKKFNTELKEFYDGFMVSEAGHYRLFIDLANQYGDPVKVKSRWQEFLDYEAGIMQSLELRGDRIH